jgi:hypothetical protein
MSVEDIIQASFDNNPVGVGQAFNDAIKDKLMDALAARREQMSMSMYGDDDEESDVYADDEDEDLDNSDTEEYEDEDA